MTKITDLSKRPETATPKKNQIAPSSSVVTASNGASTTTTNVEVSAKAAEAIAHEITKNY